MKICFVAPRYHTNQHFWVTALQEAGHEVFFLAAYAVPIAENHEALSPIIAPEGAWWLGILKYFKKDLQISSFRWLQFFLKSSRPDIVIVRDSNILLSLYAFYICKKLGISSVLYSQHPLEDAPKTHTRFLQKIGLVPKKRITPMRRDISHTQYKEAYYVPLITNYQYNASERQYNHTPLRLLFVGKFDLPRKNHLLMLQALKKLRDDGHGVRLTMVGYSAKTEPVWCAVQTFLHEHNLQKIVDIKTNVLYQDMPALYKNHDLFILPSANEPFSISPLEGMSFAVPAIITDQNGAQFCIQHDENGFVVPANELAPLIAVIKKLDDDRPLLQRVSINAFNHMQANYGSQAFIENIQAVLPRK